MIKDLTEGKPSSVLWRFSIPMFVSVIFQQFYNIADSAIAGKFAGEAALAAVGASYPITMIFMAIAVGSNIGCSVVISQLFGAKKFEEMKTAVYTTLIASVVLSAVLTVFGLWGTGLLMKMINTPANVFDDGALYLRIYIGGFLFLFLYNICTGIFTSLGDSKTPLYFLIGSSLSNIFLDYWFVTGFHMGVAGVAWATFLAQGAACVLAFFTLLFRLRRVKTEKRPAMFSANMLKRVGVIAVPSILQQSFISVGNIFIQWRVNGFGSSVIAGYSAAIKLNTFTITSFTTLANGLSSYTAQNMGAGKEERVSQGFRAGTVMAFLVAVPFAAVFFLFGKEMIFLFLPSGADVGTALSTGTTFLKIVSPFYFVVSLKLMADGVLRGAGAMRYFMAATFTDLLLRVILSFLLSVPFHSTGIWLSWPIGWTISTILSYLFYRQGKWKREVL
ncbi:MATE family efflux transporter [Lacrimispora sp. NSJ-141]|uniref:Probable multidrug resistance protein NorM n=1 Tax=Lientehia hominis TaxID=2897778 RepID=A0AAP2RHH0_9FIRM|nr:MATE family efflux transporter [Lientehia hominis]MCD2492067.1 MATE family efflux transporter [Lientehia hominis]